MSFTLQPPSDFYRHIQELKRAAEEAFIVRNAGDADDFFMVCMAMFADLRDALHKRGIVEPDAFLQSVEAHHAANNSGISDMSAIKHQDLPAETIIDDIHMAFHSVQSALTRIAEGAAPHVSLFLKETDGCLRLSERFVNALGATLVNMTPHLASLG